MFWGGLFLGLDLLQEGKKELQQSFSSATPFLVSCTVRDVWLLGAFCNFKKNEIILVKAHTHLKLGFEIQISLPRLLWDFQTIINILYHRC